MKLKINITKEVYEATKNCGSVMGTVNENCPIGYAIKEIFPDALVRRSYILIGKTKIPHSQAKFLERFDNLTSMTEKRLELPEFSFEIEIPAELVDKISLSDLEKSLTVELVN